MLDLIELFVLILLGVLDMAVLVFFIIFLIGVFTS